MHTGRTKWLLSRAMSSGVRPLRVAFFGSDDFSICSLHSVLKLQERGLIASLDVIAKHPKHTGRDLKTLTDVPIVHVAESLGVPVVRAESNAEIAALISRKYSMAVAVSYGKLIPSTFLNSVEYSLNVHPSLLPRYSGASPLQFALLNHDETTGVTVQTLHPTQFDKGTIVAQREGISIFPDETLDSLRARCAIAGAKLLSEVIESRAYQNPSFAPKYEYSYASKITPQMSQINWNTPAEQILRRYNTLGPLYTFKEINVKKRRKPQVHEWRRVILSDINRGDDDLGLTPGEFRSVGGKLLVQAADGSISVNSLQMQFEKKEPAMKFLSSLPKRAGDTTNTFSNGN